VVAPVAAVHESRISAAERLLEDMLGAGSLAGKSFSDVGCGIGLFSIAAARLGACVARSFDADPTSVACALELKRRFPPHDPRWLIDQRSALDRSYLQRLTRFDVVDAWGVLHHTGELYSALENIAERVATGARMWPATCNDQGCASRAWTLAKRLYNQLPPSFHWLFIWPALVRLRGPTTLRDLATGRRMRMWREYGHSGRGMSPWTDFVDRVGGYPFQDATPDRVLDVCRQFGSEVEKLRTCGGGRGCNQFLFQRTKHHCDPRERAKAAAAEALSAS
jgi:SAM-dependent methyltransferase